MLSPGDTAGISISHSRAVGSIRQATSLCTLRAGAISKTLALEFAVIPAKAGIHAADLWRYAVYRLDSRFRGNDCASRPLCLANDTSVRHCSHSPTKSVN